MRTNRLYPIQIMTIVISAMLGVDILMVQYDVVNIAGRNAWISVLLAGVICILFGLVFSYKLSSLYPENDYPEIILLVFGKIFGRVFLVFSTLYTLLETGLTLRIFVQALKVFLLERTPMYVLVIVFALAVISMAKRGINTIGSSVDFMFPVFVIPLLILIFLPSGQIQLDNIRPIMYKSSMEVLRGIIPAAQAMIGYNAILYFYRYVIGQSNIKKYHISAMVTSVFLYTTLTLACLFTFGAEDIKSMIYPSLNLARAITFPLVLLERLESLIITIWIPGVFAWLVLFTYVNLRKIIVLFNIKSQYKGYTAYVLIVLLTIIALIPRRDLDTLDYIRIVEYPGLFISFGFIPLMTIIALVKRRRERSK